MTALAFLPGLPVTIEQAISDLRLDLALARFLHTLAITLLILALWIDLRDEGYPSSIGRPDGRVRFRRDVCDLLRLAARHLNRPDLCRAVACGDEGQAFAVGRPARRLRRLLA